MNLALWLTRTTQRHGDRPAIGHGTRVWCSYDQLARRAAQLSAWLRAQSVAPGDRVGLFLTNRPDYLVMLWGIWWSGAAAVPINAKLHVREAAWILQHSGARLAFCDADTQTELTTALPGVALHAELPAEADGVCATQAQLAPPVDRSDSDPAWLFYTSGTTGRPKGVMITHRNLLSRDGVVKERSGAQFQQGVEEANDAPAGRASNRSIHEGDAGCLDGRRDDGVEPDRPAAADAWLL